MPSILSEADKETVKRTVPKASNKIQAVAVARLYVAHPDRNRWKYTGLQGAVVLSNDLIGNTFWLKLVDISPANRGVIWDQEIYDTFAYNQDRTFFHSFELEQCLAGLSFIDEKEAKTFMKKMNERERNASRGTKAQPFGTQQAGAPTSNGGHHSRISNFLRGNRHSSNPIPPPIPQPSYSPVTSRPTSGGIDLADPSWRPILEELKEMGITEDQIEANADFIKDYVAQKQAQQMANGIIQAVPERSKAPPPPPSAPPARMSPQNSGSTTASRRGPPPAPPPSRRPVGGRPPSPPRSSSPPRTPSPESPAQPSFRVPPPFADAGKFAVSVGRDMHPSGRQRASSNLTNPGPPPPPRPPKVEEESSSPGFRVPPPFTGDRKSSAPPAPPSRGPVPPPPPSRDAGPPPALPPKTPTSSHIPPPPPNRNSGPPPLPPSNARPIPPPPSSSSPPAPPLPFSSGPPPPPMPNMGGPPPPPPMPGVGSAPPLPTPSSDRGGLLSAIRGTGGAGVLKKVPDNAKRDRSAAVPGASDAPPPPGTAAAAPAGGLANALADALNKRKKKVSGSGVFNLTPIQHVLTIPQTTRKTTTMIGETSRSCQYLHTVQPCIIEERSTPPTPCCLPITCQP